MEGNKNNLDEFNHLSFNNNSNQISNAQKNKPIYQDLLDFEEDEEVILKNDKIEKKEEQKISLIENQTTKKKEFNNNNIHYIFNTGNIQLTSPYSDNYLFKEEQNYGRFSFITTTPLTKDYLPSPIYLKLKDVLKERGDTKEDIFYGLERTSTGELKCVDKAILEKQKGMITDIIKKVAESLSQGRGVVGVSLPVRIFEPRSLIERIVDWFAYTTVFLTPSAQLKTPIERLQNIIAFGFAGLSISVSQMKPFNPLLGETFQGTFDDGTQIFCEHTSHHPPISNFYLKGKGYVFYGRYEFIAKPNATFNTISLLQDGPNIVEFDDGEKILFYMPGIKTSGMLMGERTIKYYGNMRFIDEKNKLKAFIKFGSEKKGLFGKKKSDIVEGKLYYYNSQSKNNEENSAKKNYNSDNNVYSDLEKEIAEISGSWLDNLIIGDKEIWNINKFAPDRHKAVENPLPSDQRFREDLLWVRYQNNPMAEKWKLKLEERQRLDRKLRNEKKKIN